MAEHRRHPPAINPYDALAPVYDAYKSVEDYSQGADLILRLARDRKKRVRTVLDAATGTGNLAAQFALRGLRVTGFDSSEHMLTIARSKPQLSDSTLLRANLSDFSGITTKFDLATCWNDCINYIINPTELIAAMKCFRNCLLFHSVFVFDVNTQNTFNQILNSKIRFETLAGPVQFEPVHSTENNDETLYQFIWRSLVNRDEFLPTAIHSQRYYPPDELQEYLASAGFQNTEVFGLVRKKLVPTISERGFRKLLYVSQAS